MIVIIDDEVERAIDTFYLFAMELHMSLSEEAVMNKKARLFDSLRKLGNFPKSHPFAQHRADWVRAGYRVYSCENFLFAYQIYDEPDTNSSFVYVHDAVHSLLYHD